MVKVIVFEAKDGWRWHMTKAGRIVAESGEGYKKQQGCRRTLTRLINAIKDGKFVLEPA